MPALSSYSLEQPKRADCENDSSPNEPQRTDAWLCFAPTAEQCVDAQHAFWKQEIPCSERGDQNVADDTHLAFA